MLGWGSWWPEDEQDPFGEGHFDDLPPRLTEQWLVISKEFCCLLFELTKFPGWSSVWVEQMQPRALCGLILFYIGLMVLCWLCQNKVNYRPGPLRVTYSSEDCFMLRHGQVWFKYSDAHWAPQSWASCTPAGICQGKQAHGINHIWNMCRVKVVCVVASLLWTSPLWWKSIKT